jgi:LVIVD repeat
MKAATLHQLAKSVFVAFTTLAMTFTLHAEIRSKSQGLIVVQPRDLPEVAQMPSNSLFLHSDGSGETYLYIEQQQGARLTIFDVTDPGKIKLVESITLTVPGAFDFVRPLDGHGELVRFRDNKGVALLDLHKVKAPSLRMISGLSESGSTESLGETGFLMVNEPYNYVRATPRDYQVVDISLPSEPILLATVKEVKHEVVNDDTGTTFLLGSEGLTVVRRTSVENDYKTHLMQMSN